MDALAFLADTRRGGGKANRELVPAVVAALWRRVPRVDRERIRGPALGRTHPALSAAGGARRNSPRPLRRRRRRGTIRIARGHSPAPRSRWARSGAAETAGDRSAEPHGANRRAAAFPPCPATPSCSPLPSRPRRLKAPADRECRGGSGFRRDRASEKRCRPGCREPGHRRSSRSAWRGCRSS